jgi:hypothetical protein
MAAGLSDPFRSLLTAAMLVMALQAAAGAQLGHCESTNNRLCTKWTDGSSPLQASISDTMNKQEIAGMPRHWLILSRWPVQ